MAKIKGSPAKKGKASPKIRANATPTKPVALRRSPRKAVQSARKVEAESLSVLGKVAKKVLPTKKSSSVKKAIEGTEKRTYATAAKATPAKSPSLKKSATTSVKKMSTTTSPRKQGRPRKDSPSKTSASVTPGAKRTVKSAKVSDKSLSSRAEVEAPTTKGEWTDSPKKRSPSKRNTMSPSAAPECSIYADADDIRARQASIGGIRKSIEIPTFGKEKHGQAKGRKPNDEMNGTITRGRSPSIRSIEGSTRGRKPGTGIADTKARSRSTSVQSVVGAPRGRPKSPSKNVVKSTRTSASRSPARETSTVRTRSKSPTKLVKNVSPDTSACVSIDPPQLRALPDKSRSPSATSLRDTIKVAKTRSSHSPSKGRPLSPPRSQQTSPLRLATHVGTNRRSPSKSPTRVASKSASRASRSPSRVTLRNSSITERPSANDAHENAFKRAGSNTSTNKGNPGTRDIDEEDEIAGPSNVVQPSPKKRKASNSLESPRKKLSRSESPASIQPSVIRDDSTPLPKDRPSAPGRGTIRSVTNPEFINGGKKKNPFFETMPAPEVWHRRMPSVLPFGETPYMQQVTSNQINEDLARSKEQTNPAPSMLSEFLRRGKELLLGKPEPLQTTSPWGLPPVEQSDVERAYRKWQQNQKARVGAMAARRQHSPPKRARRRSTVTH